MGYRFFLSYAHVRSQRDEVEDFFDKLNDYVTELLPRDTGSAGFFDREMEPGAQWGEAILTALRTSRTMVVLVTEQYLDSPYCGRELGAFKARADASPHHAADLIIPVTWTPVSRPLPLVLTALQDPMGNRAFPPEYAERGLARLSRQKKYEDAYTEVVERLADIIFRNSDRLLDSPSIPPLQQTVNVLRPGDPVDGLGQLGPKNAKFVYIAAHPMELPPRKEARQAYGEEGGYWWCPFQPPEERWVGLVANEVVAQERLRYFEIPATSPDLLARIELAARSNTPVAILVDPWTLTVDRYNDIVNGIAALARETPEVEESCGVFVSWNNLDVDTQREGAALENHVNAALSLPGMKPPRHFHKQINDIGTFRTTLVDAFRTMKLRGLDNASASPAGIPDGGGPPPVLNAVRGGGAS